MFELSSRFYKAYCLAEFKDITKVPDEELPTFLTRSEKMHKRVEGTGQSITENYKCLMVLECLGE